MRRFWGEGGGRFWGLLPTALPAKRIRISLALFARWRGRTIDAAFRRRGARGSPGTSFRRTNGSRTIRESRHALHRGPCTEMLADRGLPWDRARAPSGSAPVAIRNDTRPPFRSRFRGCIVYRHTNMASTVGSNASSCLRVAWRALVVDDPSWAVVRSDRRGVLAPARTDWRRAATL